jgi:UDP-N-acetylglucosamine 2-epimerase (non-hydrolysing)
VARGGESNIDVSPGGIHFAPTEGNRLNLLAEGISDEKIYVTGDTVIDALLFAREKVRAAKPAIAGLPRHVLDDLSKKMVLITGHRRESFGGGFRAICCAIRDLARRFSNVDFVYSVHLNPNVRGVVNSMLSTKSAEARSLENIHLIDPVLYLSFVALMDRATLLLTDSGGVQEEAPSLGKPVLVMRDTTERPEAVKAGTAKLIGTKTDDIVQEVTLLLTDKVAHRVMVGAVNPYGDGKATQRILDIILRRWSPPKA